MTLQEDVSGSIGPISGTVDVEFEATVVELTASYNFVQLGNHSFGALVGGRYIKQEYDVDFVGSMTTFSGDVDESWTGFLLGLTHRYPINESWEWSSAANYGIGDSDGTYLIKTGLSWTFAESWAARFYGSYADHDFENGDRGDSDWFFYDAEEYGQGSQSFIPFSEIMRGFV